MPTRRETLAAALLAGSVGLARAAVAEPTRGALPGSEASRSITIRLGTSDTPNVTLHAGERVTLRLVNTTPQPLRIRFSDLPDRRLKPDATDVVAFRAGMPGQFDLIATGPQGVYAHAIQVQGAGRA